MPGHRPGALAGRRILDLADASGAYCGKLLADLGADVIKVEPPAGDPARGWPPLAPSRAAAPLGLSFLYHNTSKRSVRLDLQRGDDRERLLELARAADVVVETFPPGALDRLGLGYEQLRRARPGLVLTSITGFGQTGPHRDWRSCDLVASALGGAMVVTGAAEDPPVRLCAEASYVAASSVAAASSLIALRASERSGEGQHVDVSLQEVTASVSHICGVGKWLDDGIVPRRRGTGLFASVPSGAYACRDGAIYLMVNRPAHWQALARWVHEETGNREILDPMFEGPSSQRIPHRELLDLFLSEFFAPQARDALYHEAQRRHIAITPVQGAADVARDPQLASRGFFQRLEPGGGLEPLLLPGAPYRLEATPWRMRSPAAAPAAHDASPSAQRAEPVAWVARAPARRRPVPAVGGPEPGAPALAGLRVVEFGAAMAGPWIGRFLAYCGADVIRVESRRRPDVVRLYIPPGAPELGVQPQLSPWFTDWNAGKRMVALDLRHPLAIALCKRLVALADVVIENHSAGVMAKLGLAYEDLAPLRPGLVMLSSSGFGDSGPCRRYVTWGPNIEALSGSSRLSGFPWRECTITQYAHPDAQSALHGLVALLAALDHCGRTGEGQRIDLSQYESSVAALGAAWMEYGVLGAEPERRGNRSTHAAPHGCYPCRGEDRWCAIAVEDDAQWRRLCAVLGRPEWLGDSRFGSLAARLENVEALDDEVAESTRRRADYELMAELQAAGIAAGVVQTAEDLARRDRHLAARGFFEGVEHRLKGRVTCTGIPLGLSGTPGRSGLAGAAVGQDNESVFRGLLGLSEQEMRDAVEAGAIETAGEPASGPGGRGDAPAPGREGC